MTPVDGTPALESWLRQTTQAPIRLIVTENRSLMLSFRRCPDGVTVVRAHRMFLDALPSVRGALADWIRGRRDPARKTIRHFIRTASRPAQLDLPLFGSEPRRTRLRSRGKVYDLGELRDGVNRAYFDGKLTCEITWGRRMRSRARSHFTFGTYSHSANLVRIHPRLDAPDVPRFFVEFIVYHEMLHAARGQEGERNGRRVIHSKDFRAAERKFARYREAIEWERRNLAKLLG